MTSISTDGILHKNSSSFAVDGTGQKVCSKGGGRWARAERGWVISFWALGKGCTVQFSATHGGGSSYFIRTWYTYFDITDNRGNSFQSSCKEQSSFNVTFSSPMLRVLKCRWQVVLGFADHMTKRMNLWKRKYTWLDVYDRNGNFMYLSEWASSPRAEILVILLSTAFFQHAGVQEQQMADVLACSRLSVSGDGSERSAGRASSGV